MKHWNRYFLTAILAIPLAVGAQTSTGATGTAPSQGATTPNPNQAGGPMVQSSAIKVLSPKAGEKIDSSAITVSYELVNDGITAAGSPTYRLQLDARDPVETTSTDYSFSGLPAGRHVLTIDLVDANHTPIVGSRTEVQFKTGNQTASTSGTRQAGAAQTQPPQSGQQPPSGQQQPTQQQAQPQQQPQSPRAELLPPSVTKASLPLPDSDRAGELPSAAGELPLLSMVGFGVLIGGVISAMRTRR